MSRVVLWVLCVGAVVSSAAGIKCYSALVGAENHPEGATESPDCGVCMKTYAEDSGTKVASYACMPAGMCAEAETSNGGTLCCSTDLCNGAAAQAATAGLLAAAAALLRYHN